MTETARERAVGGDVPRFEVAGWRERFGVIAGITARGTAPGRGFDLGLWTDAPVGEVMTRWRAFRSAEPGFHATIVAHQVHGADVAWHDDTRGWVQRDALDGHASAARGVLLAVTVADCIPVYLVDPVHGALALLHAGWRGTAAGILETGLRTLARHAGTRPEDVVMHAGVGICGPCYEVGREVMTALGQAAVGVGPWHADLRERLVAQSAALGVGEAGVSAWCAAHDRPLFFSHRASHGTDGRMVAYLGYPAEPPAFP